MRPMPDALLTTNEELFSLSTRVRELNSTSINLDPNTRGRIIIRPSAKSYVLKRKAAAAQVENRDKLACFTSVASDALPVTPTPTTSERVPQARHALSMQESARRLLCESRPENINTPPSPMARVGERAGAAVVAQKKRRVFEGRIEKRKMSPRFRPVMKPSLQQITLPAPQPLPPSPVPNSKSRPAQITLSGPCGCHEGFECAVCRIRKLTQSFSSIITIQCDKWKASSMAQA